MATPRADSYTAPSGAVVAGGRTAAGVPVGNWRISIWGQSNDVGRADRADISASPLSADAGLAAFDAGTFDRVRIWDGSAYSLLQPSVNNLSAAGQFGPEFGVAVRWMRETSSGILFIDKWANSGLSIADGYFTHGGFPYTTAQSWRANGNAWLATHGITLSQESFVWIQGEQDNAQTQAWYAGYLSTLLATQISDGFHSATDKVVLVQMAVGSAQYGAGVAAAKVAAAAASAGNITTLDTDRYMKSDNLHWNGRGQVQVGYNLFERLIGGPHITV